MRKFFIVLAVMVGLMVSGCAGNLAQPTEVAASPTEASSPVAPTSMPTTVPTPTLEPTAVPTEVPTEVPQLAAPPMVVTSLLLDAGEALKLITQDCKPLENITPENLGEQRDFVEDYQDELLRYILEPGALFDQFRPTYFFGEGKSCVIAVYNPAGGTGLLVPNSVLVYETVEGEIRVIYTNPRVDLPFPSVTA